MNDNLYKELENVAENTPITAEQILTRIDRVLDDRKHIEEAFDLLTPKGGIPADGNTAHALGIMVQAREETNRKILGILETQLDKLTKTGNDDSMKRLKELVEILREGQQDDMTGNYAATSMGIVKDIANKLFDIK